VQTRKQSLIEVVVSTALAFWLSVGLQVILAWAYSVPMTLSQNIQWTIWFTLLALVRSYFMRRFFNWLHNRK
jgi:hypothetical protein